MVINILEKLKRRWEQTLRKQASDLDRVLDPVLESFVASGIRIPVWRTLGSKEEAKGIVVDGYIGYGEVGGVWALYIKTIEHEGRTGAVLGCRIEKPDALHPFIKESISEIPAMLKEMEILMEGRIKDLKTVQETIRANLN